MERKMRGLAARGTLVFGLALLSACGGNGTWAVTVYGEEFIEDGIAAEEFVDGWAVSFSTFDVRLGAVVGRDATGQELARLDDMTTYDLTISSEGAGQDVGEREVPAGMLASLDYDIGEGEGCALHVVGDATKAGDEKTFDWCLTRQTTYQACETTAEVPVDARGESQVTVHADHLFYDDLVSEEPHVAFDLIAEADTDADGAITETELRALSIVDEARYQVGSADVEDLWTFIEAQSQTVGHIDGEGHCDTN